MTTQTNKDNQFYVSLLSTASLSRDEVRAFYRFVKCSIASGLLSSFQVERPDYGLDTVRLIHKTDASGANVYEIPLTRHLTDKEFDQIDKAFQMMAEEGQILITSGIRIQDALSMPVGAPQIEPEIYATFCDTLAKLQHSNWMLERQDAGWRYGLTHDAKERTTPLMRPWEDLPNQYKKIDKKLPGQIFELLESMGYVVVPQAIIKKMMKKR